MLEHGDAHAAFNGLIAVHHQEPIDHRFRVVAYNLAAGERHFCTGLYRLTHPRTLNDTPRLAAITLVAPGERFNAFAIFVTPCLSLAIDFNNLRSSLVHDRRIRFFFFGETTI